MPARLQIKSIVSESRFNEPKLAVIDFNGESCPLKKTNVSITKKNFVIDRENFLTPVYILQFLFVFHINYILNGTYLFFMCYPINMVSFLHAYCFEISDM